MWDWDECEKERSLIFDVQKDVNFIRIIPYRFPDLLTFTRARGSVMGKGSVGNYSDNYDVSGMYQVLQN